MFWWKYVYPNTTRSRYDTDYLWARPLNDQSVLSPWFVIRQTEGGVVLSVGCVTASAGVEHIVGEFPTEEGAKFAAELIGDPAACIKETEK